MMQDIAIMAMLVGTITGGMIGFLFGLKMGWADAHKAYKEVYDL